MSARSLKHVLQGRWLGHPLHPVLVHLPIGLWMLSFVLDVIALATMNEEAGPFKPLNKGPLYTLLAGLFLAVLAAVTGFADYADVRTDHPARTAAWWHMVFNLCAIGTFAVSTALRLAEVSPPWSCVLASGIGVALISVSGYLGGVMVYDDGIGAGRHRRGFDPPPETVKVTASPDDGYVEVIDSADVVEAVPLRADVNGHVMTIVRLGGAVYAFQEFCTHRCGPLSEGTFGDGNVVCPWHRSRFDVRTGKVTDGPAKVDLKTYAVREQDGRVAVKIA